MSDQLLDLLDDLETALQRQRLWDAQPPSPDAMASTLPFCIDSMHFQQWLQWIYIPRLRALIDAGAPLPGGSAILPYAEESFKLQGLRGTREILILIAHCDRVLS